MPGKIFHRTVFHAAADVQPVGKTAHEAQVFYPEVGHPSYLTGKSRGADERDVLYRKPLHAAHEHAGRHAVETVALIIAARLAVAQPFGIFLAPHAAGYRNVAVEGRVVGDFVPRAVRYALVANQQRFSTLYEYDFRILVGENRSVRTDYQRAVDVVFTTGNMYLAVILQCCGERGCPYLSVIVRLEIATVHASQVDFVFFNAYAHTTGSPET